MRISAVVTAMVARMPVRRIPLRDRSSHISASGLETDESVPTRPRRLRLSPAPTRGSPRPAVRRRTRAAKIQPRCARRLFESPGSARVLAPRGSALRHARSARCSPGKSRPTEARPGRRSTCRTSRGRSKSCCGGGLARTRLHVLRHCAVTCHGPRDAAEGRAGATAVVTLLGLGGVRPKWRPSGSRVVGWPTGLEPVTFGATIRCSAG